MSKKAAKQDKNAAVLTQRDTIQRPLNIMRAGSTKRPPIMQRITPRKPLKRTWKNTAKQHENGPNGAASVGGHITFTLASDHVTTPDDALPGSRRFRHRRSVLPNYDDELSARIDVSTAALSSLLMIQDHLSMMD